MILQPIRRLSLAAVAIAVTSSIPRVGQVTDLRISSIEARLFLSHTGGFSENFLDRRDVDLLNTEFAGPPWGPSRQFLVTVRLEGPVGRSLTGLVRARASRRGTEIANASVTVRGLERGGRSFVGFLVNHTGCDTIRLSVELLAPSSRVMQREERAIPFYCGE